MYPNTHGVVGTLCAIATYSITNDYFSSSFIAFISHDVMDRLGEKRFQTLFYHEAVLFAIFCFLAWKSDQTILYAIGWIGGNLMDFIDKKFGLSIWNNAKYPYGQFFRCHRRKPSINLTSGQTILSGYLSIILLIALYLIEKS